MSDFDNLTREEAIALLKVQWLQIEELKAQVAQLLLLSQQQARRIEQLEKQLGLGPPSAPSFVRANKPASVNKTRKKRDIHFVRKREEPTQVVDHKPECCPDCARKLEGGSPFRTRQVLDIAPSPLIVTDHVIWQRYCGVCRKRVLAKPDLSEQALGKRRIGLNLTSWIASLHIERRIPLRMIAKMLRALFGVHVSVGEMVDLLDAVAAKGAKLISNWTEQVRAAPFGHADETGWRENGQNGYLWSLSTPGIRLFSYDKSRSGATAKEFVGEDFTGTLVTDFYCAYNALTCRHQRCWVHFLRDLHKLREGAGEAVNDWVDRIVDLYARAKKHQADSLAGRPFGFGVFDRRRARKLFEEELYALAEPYIDDAEALQNTLAKRVGMFLSELFTFIEFPDVPPDNNAAERAVRHAVIFRKITGGSRSAKGSKTTATLMSLFGTWSLRGLDTVQQCKLLLSQTK